MPRYNNEEHLKHIEDSSPMREKDIDTIVSFAYRTYTALTDKAQLSSISHDVYKESQFAQYNYTQQDHPIYFQYVGALADIVTSCDIARSRTTAIKKLLESTDPPAVLQLARGARYKQSIYQVLTTPKLSLRDLQLTLEHKPHLKTEIDSNHRRTTNKTLWQTYNAIEQALQILTDGHNKLAAIVATNNKATQDAITELMTKMDNTNASVKDLTHILQQTQPQPLPLSTNYNDDNNGNYSISTIYTDDELIEMGEDPSNPQTFNAYNDEYLTGLGIDKSKLPPN